MYPKKLTERSNKRERETPNFNDGYLIRTKEDYTTTYILSVPVHVIITTIIVITISNAFLSLSLSFI